MIDIYYLNYNTEAPCSGYWDMTMLNDIFESIYEYNFNIKDVRSVPKESDFCIIILPGRSQIDYVEKLNEDIKSKKGVLLFITGDEEALYPVENIRHNNIKIYTMSYEKENTNIFPNGYAPDTKKYRILDFVNKDVGWFFSGQITHLAREAYAAILRTRDDGILYESKGFTQGLEHEEYFKGLEAAVVAPCPGGPVTPDTFRLYESLELGCIPITDDIKHNGYWNIMFKGGHPIPVMNEYMQLDGYIDDVIRVYPEKNIEIFSWWINTKANFRDNIIQDIKELSKQEPNKNEITYVVPTSPIKSIPDTYIIEETLDSIRHQDKTGRIIVTFDYPREQDLYRLQQYQEYIYRVLWKLNHKYGNVYTLIMNKHSHQVEMMKQALKYINTKYIAYLEHDTPFVTDYDIPLKELTKYLNDGTSNLIRFHFEADIPKEHNFMMLGMEKNLPLMRTCQWSQRPHISTAAYYKEILNNYFSENAICFIEDKMHGVVHNAYRENGTLGWNIHKLHIYKPDGNIKRSYHTDGRGGEEKYDNEQIF